MEPLCACGYCLLVEPAMDEAGGGGEGWGVGVGGGVEAFWAESLKKSRGRSWGSGDGGLGTGCRWGEEAMVLQYTVKQPNANLEYNGLHATGLLQA